MRVELLYFEDCPNWRTADDHLQRLATDLGFVVQHRVIASADEADALELRGSPTILIDGRDPFAKGSEPIGLSCRIYHTDAGPAGSPTRAQLRVALSRTSRPAN